MASQTLFGGSMTSNNRLVVRDLTVAFARSGEAVQGVRIEVGPGEAVGLVGESGSGKSLTLRAILGLLPRGASVSGHIHFANQSLLTLSEREWRQLRGTKIGMIFQDPSAALNPVLRVGDAIAQVVRSHDGVDRRAAMRRAIALMERVGIRDASRRARAYPHEFSGGMRQRIMIAMALSARPALLLADEPTTALDVIVQDGILRLLNRIRREEGMGLLFVSHDLAVVASMCDRVAVMYAGQLVEVGPTADVLFNPHMPYTIGLVNSAPKKGIKRLNSIPGRPPFPGETTEGCKFASRCTIATGECRQSIIPAVEIESGHWARCLHTSDSNRLKLENNEYGIAVNRKLVEPCDRA